MKIGIFHPTDLAGHVPGGIDTFIRGIMRWAPADLKFVLFGATSDSVARPVGKLIEIASGRGSLTYLPLVTADATARRKRLPLTVRYLVGLRRALHSGLLADLDAMDFHRIETALAFHRDPRPRNLFIHQDMAVLRSPDCDIGWRHAPWLYETLESIAFRRLKRIFTVRQSAVDRYRIRYESLREKFAFVPTWVETDSFFPLDAPTRQAQRAAVAAELAIDTRGPWVISVGRLDRQKDPLLMLEAFARYAQTSPDARLLMIGDGILRSEVEARSRSADLRGRVNLCGALSPVQIARFLQVGDAFLLTSAYEGMPIVVLEALACGLPVVTTDVGEVRRGVKHDINGAIVGVRDPQSIAAALARVLTDRDRLAFGPCVAAASAYTPQTVLSQIYDNHRAQQRS